MSNNGFSSFKTFELFVVSLANAQLSLLTNSDSINLIHFVLKIVTFLLALLGDRLISILTLENGNIEDAKDGESIR